MKWLSALLALLAGSAGAQTYQAETRDKLVMPTLRLHADHTYENQNRGDSCWLWWDESGTWTATPDFVYLRTTVEKADIDSAIRGSRNHERDTIRVEVRDEKKGPVSNARVTLNYDGPSKLTDESGVAVLDAHALGGAKLEWISVNDDGGIPSVSQVVDAADNVFHVTLVRKALHHKVIKRVELRRAEQSLVDTDPTQSP